MERRVMAGFSGPSELGPSSSSAEAPVSDRFYSSSFQGQENRHGSSSSARYPTSSSRHHQSRDFSSGVRDRGASSSFVTGGQDLSQLFRNLRVSRNPGYQQQEQEQSRNARHHHQNQQQERLHHQRHHQTRRPIAPDMGFERSPLLVQASSSNSSNDRNKYYSQVVRSSGSGASAAGSLSSSQSFHHRLGARLSGGGSRNSSARTAGTAYNNFVGKASSAYQGLDAVETAVGDDMFITSSATSNDIAGGLASRLSGLHEPLAAFWGNKFACRRLIGSSNTPESFSGVVGSSSSKPTTGKRSRRQCFSLENLSLLENDLISRDDWYDDDDVIAGAAVSSASGREPGDEDWLPGRPSLVVLDDAGDEEDDDVGDVVDQVLAEEDLLGGVDGGVDVDDLISYDVADPSATLGLAPGSGHHQRLSLNAILGMDSVKTLTFHPLRDELGFAFRDDREKGFGYCVTKVNGGSPADREGLCPGDMIVAVNDVIVDDMPMPTEKQLLEISPLSLVVVSAEIAEDFKDFWKLRKDPANEATNDIASSYRWVNSRGEDVSPPPLQYDSSAARDSSSTIRKVTVTLKPEESLGLSIRGGREYGLGIYVTGVERNSAAEKAGIRIGDEILEVNSRSFRDVTHANAVNCLKLWRRFVMLLRYVGRVPHSQSPLPGNSSSSLPSNGQRRSSLNLKDSTDAQTLWSELEMIHEKARCYLSQADHSRLAYYCQEYANGAMSVDAFVAVLLEILDTDEKRTILNEIRDVLSSEDHARFEEMTYWLPWSSQTAAGSTSGSNNVGKFAQRGVPGRMSNYMVTQSGSPIASEKEGNKGNKLMGNGSSSGCPFPDLMGTEDLEETRTPSEDSGVDLALNGSSHMHRKMKFRQQTGFKDGKIMGKQMTMPSQQQQMLITSRFQQQQRGTSNGKPSGGMGDMMAMGGDSAWPVPHQQRQEAGNYQMRPTRWDNGRDWRDDDSGTPMMGPNGANGGSSNGRLQLQLQGQPGNGRMLSFLEPNKLELPSSKRRIHREAKQSQHPSPEISPNRTWLKLHDMMRAATNFPLPGEKPPLGILGGPHVVRIKKTRPTLGVAIEGGANTKRRLPRIITIHAEGSAFETEGLRIGQTILEIDGRLTEGMTHSEIAQAICKSFANPNVSELLLTVTDGDKATGDVVCAESPTTGPFGSSLLG